MLGFEGFYSEEILYSPIETTRTRRVTINYFLEDNTIMVKEKKAANSGLPQGVLIKVPNLRIIYQRLYSHYQISNRYYLKYIEAKNPQTGEWILSLERFKQRK